MLKSGWSRLDGGVPGALGFDGGFDRGVMNLNTMRFSIFLFTLLLVLEVGAETIDTSYYYRLTNLFAGETRSLDTYADGENAPFMGETGNFSGQYWRLSELPNDRYRLTNKYLGGSRSLDTYADGGNELFMGHTGNFSGQFWVLIPQSNGTYRLHNDFLGTERSLDSGKSKPSMGDTGHYSGQYWILTAIQKI